MTRKNLKSIAFSLVAIIILFSSTAIAQSIVKTIKVTFDTFTLKSSSKSSSIQTINYNNTLYIPLNKVSDVLDKKVVVNNKINSIELVDKVNPNAIGYSITSPAELNTPLTILFDEYSKYKAKVTVKEVIRGDEAWKLIYTANEFNNEPRSGHEYILAKINIELLEGQGSYKPSFTNFALISEKGKVYPNPSIVEPTPDLEEASLYKGASHEGWLTFEVEKSDLKPVIAFGRKYDGTSGIWFKAYK